MPDRPTTSDRGPIVVGALLIALGLVFLVGQYLDIDAERYGWPFFVIAPGVVIWLIALIVGGPVGVGFSIVGAITTVTGLLLLYQDTTGHWESWAYAWALVAPGSVGVALFVQGLVHGERELIESGWRTAAVGLGLFLGFGVFFEGIIGIGGTGPAAVRDVILPGGLLLLGVIVVLGSLVGQRRSPR